MRLFMRSCDLVSTLDNIVACFNLNEIVMYNRQRMNIPIETVSLDLHIIQLNLPAM